jgi:hypothetical protein
MDSPSLKFTGPSYPKEIQLEIDGRRLLWLKGATSAIENQPM